MPSFRAISDMDWRVLVYMYGTKVANTTELIETVAKMVAMSRISVPISLMNHEIDEVAEIISGVVENCFNRRVTLKRVALDPEFADALGLSDGKGLGHGDYPVVEHNSELRRQVRFEKA